MSQKRKVVIIGKNNDYPAKNKLKVGHEVVLKNEGRLLNVFGISEPIKGEPLGGVFNVKHPNIAETFEQAFLSNQELALLLKEETIAKVIDIRKINLKMEASSLVIICEFEEPEKETEIETEIVEEESLSDIVEETKALLSATQENEIEVPYAANVATYVCNLSPITLRHIDDIKKASKMFNKVIVGIPKSLRFKGPNQLIELSISPDERKRLADTVLEEYNLTNVEVCIFEDDLVDFMKRKKSTILIRSIESAEDYKYEFKHYSVIKTIFPEVEIAYIMKENPLNDTDVSIIEYLFYNHNDISRIVPKSIQEDIKSIIVDLSV